VTIGLARRRAKPRWLALAGVVILVLGIGATAALAVHDQGVFELDGDPETGFHLNDLSDPTDSHDWDEVYADFLAGDHDPDTNLSGAEAFSFVTDITGQGDNILFGGSTKDINDLPSWASKQTASTSVQDKDDIAHAFVAQYLDGTDVLLYFGADRFANSGDTTMGFWLYHEEVTNVNNAFTGNHQARSATQRGDVLIVSDFLNGGAAPTVQVFEWVDSGGSASTHLDKIAGSDVLPAACNGGVAPKVNATPVPPVGADDDLCATTNQKVYSPTVWDFTPKANAGAPQTYPISTFLEGGINLTALGFGNDCFASFLAETRASHSVTSTLSDYALGGFGECETTVTTTPADGAGSDLTDGDDADTLPEAQLGTGSAGVDVTDNVEVEVSGIQTWSGTVDFFICGPISSGTCDTGGVASGSANVDQDNPTGTSDPANLTEVGRYCWRGEFTPSESSANSGVDSDSDASEGECFEVLPVTPNLSTTAWSSGDDTGEAQTEDVPFGSPLFDKASLTGTANEPGDNGGDGDGNYLSINATNGAGADGTITFTLIGPDDCSTVATGSAGDNPEDVGVDGDDDYFTSGFTTDSPGDFHWQAVYDGSTSGNTLGTDHNLDCSEEAEDVTVEQLQPTMDTEQEFVPNDSATITVDAGAGDLDGYVVFKLYVDNPTCTGDADYTSDNSLGDFDVFDSDDPGDTTLTATIGSDNTVAYKVSGTTFHWVVEFHSNNGAHLDVTSGCGNETSSITIDNGATQPE